MCYADFLLGYKLCEQHNQATVMRNGCFFVKNIEIRV
jgi:hypothetical protein